MLIAIFVASIVTSIPILNINVQAATTMKTYPIVDAIPNPVAVGQETLLKAGISEALPSASYGWTGITITVKKPDGTTTTLGPLTTDSTGSTYATYVPDQVGNYTVTTNFPNQTYPITYTPSGRTQPIQAGTIMLASSKSMTLEVVEELSIPFYPGHALPTEYWSRPIDPQLREWYSISGNWVERPFNSVVQFQDDAPETPHILWATPYEQGGISGGLYDGENNIIADMYGGDAYEGRFANAVVINGVLYYNTQPNGLYAQVSIPGIQAIDLHTGEKLWFLNNTFLSFGQTMFYPSYNVNGVWNYLWSVNGNNYTAYSTNDGSFQFMFYNVPTGTRIWGPNGEILIYQINYAAGWMALWNSTLAGLQNAVMGQPTYGSWSFGTLGMDANGRGSRDVGGPTNPTNAIGQQINSAFPVTRCLNGSLAKCYSWNVTIPKTLAANSLRAYEGDRIVGIAFNQTMVRVWALPLNGITATRNASISSGSISPIFDKTWTPPSEWLEGSNILYYTGASNYVKDPIYGNGVIAVWSKELTTHYGFSLVDGSYLWATEPEHYLDLYGAGAGEHTWYFAYGKLYSVGLAGILYAYNLQTGKTDWTYTLKDPYTEPVTGENWWGWISHIAAGKVYIGTLEHSANSPMPRGGPYACVNATDGSEIFRVNGMMRLTRWGGNPVMGDSIIAGYDTYDLQIYAMGKGPSKITVSAPNLGAAQGQSVLISGRVTDISPGTTDPRIAMRFPNGVAAVSDASQGQYMLYVYKQFECPTDATGVPVSLAVIDANGNYREIGTTTSDVTGFYSFSWMPDIPGKYTVIATFAGSKAYYGSYDQAAFVVDEAHATAPPQATPEPSAADLYFVPGIAGVIITIIAVGVAIILLQRKRP
ncbi:MAG: carboxypeptidase-like regulatory domain-containing protein [Candidatus Bathyarchaeota archaeon]|nr:carboxypeptidase-like regulatory domain-containing protein [Candidatus Bathyarchaeota archaeon]